MCLWFIVERTPLDMAHKESALPRYAGLDENSSVRSSEANDAVDDVAAVTRRHAGACAWSPQRRHNKE